MGVFSPKKKKNCCGSVIILCPIIKIRPKGELNEGIKLGLTHQLLILHIWGQEKKKGMVKCHMSADLRIKGYVLQSQPQI